MTEQSSVLRRNPRVEYRTLADEGGVLLHLDTASYHGVNEVGALVWELLEGVTLDQLIGLLHLQLEDLPPSFEDEIRTYVSELVERDLILVGTPES